jgi:midasin
MHVRSSTSSCSFTAKSRFASHAMQAAIVEAYLPAQRAGAVPVHGIVAFFRAARALAPSLSDGAAPPPFNLRSLTRALRYAAAVAPAHGAPRALHNGLCMCFVAMLDDDSAQKVLALIRELVLCGARVPSAPVAVEPPPDLARRGGRYVNIEVRPRQQS